MLKIKQKGITCWSWNPPLQESSDSAEGWQRSVVVEQRQQQP